MALKEALKGKNGRRGLSLSSSGHAWTFLITGVAVIMAIPVFVIAASLSFPFNEQWQHLFKLSLMIMLYTHCF